MKLFKILRSVLAGIIWGGIFKLISKDYFRVAMLLFKLYEKLTLSMDEEGLLIKGYLFAVLGEDDESLKCFRKAKLYIEKNNEINEKDKNYLNNYIYVVLNKIGINVFDFNNDVNVDLVTKHYLYLFPYEKLRKH
jgi:hypothetical protein